MNVTIMEIIQRIESGEISRADSIALLVNDFGMPEPFARLFVDIMRGSLPGDFVSDKELSSVLPL